MMSLVEFPNNGPVKCTLRRLKCADSTLGTPKLVHYLKIISIMSIKTFKSPLLFETPKLVHYSEAISIFRGSFIRGSTVLTSFYTHLGHHSLSIIRRKLFLLCQVSQYLMINGE